MWIERRLRDPRLPAAARAELEALRAKALAGRLTAAEFRAMRARMRGTVAPLRALVARLRALRQAAGRAAGVPPAALDALDGALHHLEAALAAPQRLARAAARHRRRAAG